MAIERFYERQGPVAFTANGGTNGVVTVSDVLCFKVKQKVVISSDTQPNLPLEIKRILSFTQVVVGPVRSKQVTGNTEHNMKLREDVSSYLLADNAKIRAEEQPKPRIPQTDIQQAIYETEPTLALRTIGVDKVGVPWGKNNPLPVDSGVTGIPIKHLQFGTFTDISETKVATLTATAANTKISKLFGEAQTFGVWRIYKDTVSMVNLVAVTRTSFSTRNAEILLETPEVLSNIGDQLLITFEAERYRSSILGASATTFVRLEGAF